MEHSAFMDNQIATSLSAQPDMGEEIDSVIDPEVAAMLEEGDQALREGIDEQEVFDREMRAAFELLDYEDPTWNYRFAGSDRSGAVSVASVRSYGFGSLPDEFRYIEDEARSTGTAAGSLDFDLSESVQEIYRRPILKPKTRVKASRAEKNEVASSASSSMMPAFQAERGEVASSASPSMMLPAQAERGEVASSASPSMMPPYPSISVPSIPSSGQRTMTFLGATITVPVLQDTTYQEPVNPMSVTNTVPASSGASIQELVGTSTAQQVQAELAAVKQSLAASGMREACLKADVRRLGEDLKILGDDLKISEREKVALESELDRQLHVVGAMRQELSSESRDLMNRMKEQQEQSLTVQLDEMKQQVLLEVRQMEAKLDKERSIIRGALDASRKMCNDLNKEKNGLELTVSQLANEVSHRNKELELRTQERDFVVQKLNEAGRLVDEASSVQSRYCEQIAIMNRKISDLQAGLDKTLGECNLAQHRVIELEQRCEELSRDLGREREFTNSYQLDIQETSKAKDVALEEVSKLNEKFGELDATSKDDKRTISKLEREIEALNNEVEATKISSNKSTAAYESEIKSLKDFLKDAKVEKNYTAELLDKRNEEYNTLSNDSSCDKKEIIQLKALIENLKLTPHNEEISTLKKNSAQDIEKIAHLEAKLEESTKLSHDLQAKLEETRIANETIKNSLIKDISAQHEKKIADFKARLEHEVDVSRELQAKLDKTQTTMKSKTDLLIKENSTQYINEITNIKTELEKEMAVSRDLQAKLEESRKTNDAQKSSFKKDLSTQDKKIANLEAQLKKARIIERDFAKDAFKMADLEDKLEANEIKLNSLMEEKAAQDTKVANLEAELEEARSTKEIQINSLMEEKSAQDTEIANLEAELEEARSTKEIQINSLMEKKSAQDTKIANLEADLEKARIYQRNFAQDKSKMSDLEDKLKKLHAKLDEERKINETITNSLTKEKSAQDIKIASLEAKLKDEITVSRKLQDKLENVRTTKDTELGLLTKEKSAQDKKITELEVQLKHEISRTHKLVKEMKTDFLTRDSLTVNTKTGSLPLDLLMLFFYLFAAYFITRFIYLSANEITRSFMPHRCYSGNSSSCFHLRERFCFWLIQRTGYVYSLRG